MNSEFENQVNDIKKIKEVQAITLYGSHARGDSDEGSDIDLLILFKNREDLNSTKDQILGIRSRSKLFLQLTMFTLDEFFSDCNPVFVRSILKDGKILFQKSPAAMERKIQEFIAKYPELFQPAVQ